MLNNKMFPDITAIVAAAGTGKRMNISIPKQYLTIANKTVLEHVIDTLLLVQCIKNIIIVINSNDYYFNKLSLSKNSKLTVIHGGISRFYSVINALRYIKYTKWVIVHDAVRPCLHKDDLYKLLLITNYSTIGGILAIPVTNTIKVVNINNNIKLVNNTLNRNKLWQALTPQIFNFELLKYCFEQILKENISVTDESSVLEYFGYKPIVIHGRSDNIKITNKSDIILIKNYFNKFKYY
ncbi:MAG: 2-C-methyl-D-erythritol 4-phosphate cytidylyltransferase [Candidatus Lightella neohaematopini]|nr:2-C-methyl-D-erythritol 4-phosphate cytidylyltransferase [Candidatus Lightella neohaematopini]MCV2531017.1 2-C-methyl-D-erythritol 4-phosphate cytidylyltransferase [Candidatus Lightella neohaematopini]